MRRQPLILLAFLLLAACSGVDRVGFGDTAARPQLAAAAPISATVEPRLGSDSITMRDGTALPLRRWLPATAPRAVVLALHGFNDYSNAFTRPAPDWAENGIATFAFDQRGFGAGPQRGRWAGARQMSEDVATAARLLRARYPSVPLYLLGESMGGAVAIVSSTGAAGAPRPDVDGVVLVAPAVWGRQTMNVFERTGLFLARLVPSMQLSGRSLPIKRHPSDNIPMLRAYSADPLVIKETRADTLNGLVDLMSLAQDAASRLDLPALVLYGDHDDIVPRAPVVRMIDRLPAAAQARQRVAFYPNGYHMLLRDLQAQMVIGDVAAWIADRSALLPSGADGEASALLSRRNPAIASAGAPHG